MTNNYQRMLKNSQKFMSRSTCNGHFVWIEIPKRFQELCQDYLTNQTAPIFLMRYLKQSLQVKSKHHYL